MDNPIVLAAVIGGWSTIVAGLLDVRSRVNGQLDKKLALVKDEIRDSKIEIIGIKSDIRELRNDVRCISDHVSPKED